MDTQFLESISRALQARRVKVRAGDVAGEYWLDHNCLFHDDAHASASFEISTGVYYCRAETRSFQVREVAHALGVRDPAELVVQTSRPVPELPEPPPDTVVFTYRQLDGEPTHLKWRQGNGSAKKIWQTALNGKGKPPSERSHVYAPWPLPPEDGACIVVEGENKVEAIAAAADHFQDMPIYGITCGAAQDLTNHARELVAWLKHLKPRYILLWPDNDDPGRKAMKVVAQTLAASDVPHHTYRYDHDHS